MFVPIRPDRNPLSTTNAAPREAKGMAHLVEMEQLPQQPRAFMAHDTGHYCKRSVSFKLPSQTLRVRCIEGHLDIEGLQVHSIQALNPPL